MRALVELTCDDCGQVIHHLLSAATPEGWREGPDGRVTCPAHGSETEATR